MTDDLILSGVHDMQTYILLVAGGAGQEEGNANPALLLQHN